MNRHSLPVLVNCITGDVSQEESIPLLCHLFGFLVHPAQGLNQLQFNRLALAFLSHEEERCHPHLPYFPHQESRANKSHLIFLHHSLLNHNPFGMILHFHPSIAHILPHTTKYPVPLIISTQHQLCLPHYIYPHSVISDFKKETRNLKLPYLPSDLVPTQFVLLPPHMVRLLDPPHRVRILDLTTGTLQGITNEPDEIESSKIITVPYSCCILSRSFHALFMLPNVSHTNSLFIWYRVPL